MIQFPINPQQPQPAGAPSINFGPPPAALAPGPPPLPGSSVLRPVCLPTSALTAYLE